MSTASQLALIAGALTLSLSGLAHGQGCDSYWVKPDPFDTNVYGGPFCAFDDGNGSALYAVVSFRPVNPAARVSFARWNGKQWQVLSGGLPPLEYAFVLGVLDDGSGPGVYVQGIEHTLGGYVYHGYKWNTGGWVETPPGLMGDWGQTAASPWVSYDNGTGMAMYGMFHDDLVGDYPVRWNGQSWVAIGGVLQDALSWRMKVLDMGAGPRLYIAGNFDGIGSLFAPGIVEWDGLTWRGLGTGIYASDVKALEVFDAGQGKELYVIGNVGQAGGLPVQDSAKWNGEAWSALASAPIAATGATVFNDGLGETMYFIGPFSTVGGVNARGIAKFDGHQWYSLGAGIDAGPNAITAFDDGRGPSLFISVGGPQTTAGGGFLGPGTAQWVGCGHCYVNCDKSTASPVLNVNDFTCFLNHYAVRDPYANCTVDTTINAMDFVCFMNKFAAGCP